MNVVLILSVSVFVFMLLYFASQMPHENEVQDGLKIFLILFAVALSIYIPKAAMDAQTTCDWLPSNSTTVGNTTSYQYTTYCYTETASTPTSFYKAVMWFVRIFWGIILIAMLVEMVKYFGKLTGGKNV